MNIDENFFKDRQKFYLHFDESKPASLVYKYVTCPKNIEKHSFYPFIHFETTIKKIYKERKIIKGKIKKVVKKKPNKIRPIKYCSHIDGHIYAYYAHLLSDHYEKVLDERNLSNVVLAFRKLDTPQSNINFAKTVFDEIKKRQNCSVVCIDIKGFFDNLDHVLLKQAWCRVLNCDKLPKDHYQIYKSITKYAYVEKDQIYSSLGISLNSKNRDLKRLCSSSDFRSKIRKENLILINNEPKGIPQGSPISAFLSNIYMIDFDIKIQEICLRNNWLYLRYCDDVILICDNHIKANMIVISQIDKIKLEVQTDKTQISIFQNGLLLPKPENKPVQYLGFTYDGKKVLLRDSGLAKYSHKVMKVVRMSNKKLLKINSSRELRNLEPLKLNKKHIYRRFTYIGQRNYISYALRASKIMSEPAISKQIKPHWKRLHKHLSKYED